MKLNENAKLAFSKWFKRFKTAIFIVAVCLAFAWSPIIKYTKDNNTIMITLDLFGISISNLTTFDKPTED